MAMTTVKDIAEYAGVSIGTVDRVLHGRGRVSPATEQRVLEAIKTLGYRPNMHARNLVKGQTYVFRVLSPAPESDSGYWRFPLRGIDRALGRLSMSNVSVEQVRFDRHDEQGFVNVLDSVIDGADGLLVAPVVSGRAASALMESITTSGIPTVSFDSRLEYGRASEAPTEHDSKGIGFVGQSPWEGGRTAGRLADLLRRPGTAVASVTLGGKDSHLLERARAFRAYWEGKPAGPVGAHDGRGPAGDSGRPAPAPGGAAGETGGPAGGPEPAADSGGPAHAPGGARGDLGGPGADPGRPAAAPGSPPAARVHEIMLSDHDREGYIVEAAERFAPILEELAAVFVTNAESQLVVEAIRRLGYRGNIPLVGYDLLSRNIELLREGSISAVISQKPEEQGYEAMNMLLQHVVFGRAVPRQILMPVEVILPENLSSFLTQQQTASGGSPV